MNILFLTMSSIESYNSDTLYNDLINKFIEHGHHIDLITPIYNKKTFIEKNKNCRIVHTKIINQHTKNLIKKGISTLSIDIIYTLAIKKYLSLIHYDLVLYSTPPITICKSISYIKKRDSAKSFLMLKDIFPQNAIDIKLLTTSGKDYFIYTYFRKKEKNLYKISDYIGCMSKANIDYLLKNNPNIPTKKVLLLPNAINTNKTQHSISKKSIRKKYNLPLNKTIFIYGGNLGKPQGIPFLIDCLKTNEYADDRFFLICGDGTERILIEKYINKYKPKNTLLLNMLTKSKFEDLVSASDIGMIFLDYRFTIPNYPSRLLPLLHKKLPVLACTDLTTDIGKTITENNFGWWCPSNDTTRFKTICDIICSTENQELTKLGENGYNYLLNNFSTDSNYNTIINAILCNESNITL